MDVFLSYSRANVELCDDICKLIESLGLSVFVDRDMPGGVQWEEELRQQLSRDASPIVVLLATTEARDRPDWIRKELALAAAHELTIVPLEFDPGAASQIIGHARIQTLSTARTSSGHAQLARQLRVALTGRRLQRALDHMSGLTQAWADSLTQGENFWKDVWPDFLSALEPAQGLVILGPAGAGKSTVAARVVSSLKETGFPASFEEAASVSERVFPILLDESVLRDRGEKLARDLGSRPGRDLAEYLQGCRQHHRLRVVFVLDGLDQMAPEANLKFKDYAEALASLTLTATTVITCRPEVWEMAYRPHVSIPTQSLAELPAHVVSAAVLRAYGRDLQASSLLRRPLFLDLALRNAAVWKSVPAEEIDFLTRLWTTLMNRPRTPGVGTQTDVGIVLDRLAARQILVRSFSIDRAALEQELGPAAGPTIDRLVGERLLRETRGPERRLRFVHDLLDAYNMARRLLGLSSAERRTFYDAIDADGMYSVVAMLAALAPANSSNGIRHEIFVHLLRVLDRKRLSTRAMGRAWAATYALQERFDVFLPLILECFATDSIAPSLKAEDAEGGSSIDPPRLTQEAASTLASAFQAIQAGRVTDAERILPRLVGKLATWRYRARVIEAIAKYDSPVARDALLGFARGQLDDGSDPEALENAVNALRLFDHEEAVTTLQAVLNHPGGSSRLRRVAAASLASLRPGSVSVPEQDDDEIALELRPFDVDREGRRLPGYSDWRRVEHAALDVERRILSGESLADVVAAALVLALEHDQTAVRCPVARCLGLLDDPRASEALIRELTEPGVPAEVRIACTHALRTALQRATGFSRQAIRVAMMRAALHADKRGDSIGGVDLRSLALDRAWTADPPIDAGAAALFHPAATGAGFSVLLERSAEPPDADLATLPTSDELAAAGPELERKFRFDGLSATGSALTLRMADSSWQLGRAFHRIAREDPSRVPLVETGAFRLPIPLGRSRLPGLAVIHGLATTADGQILAARRAANLSYAANHWSLSFEEQITEAGDGLPEHPVEAAARGFREEFGLDVDQSNAVVLGPILEIDSLNIGIVVWLRVPIAACELQRAWKGPPRPSHHHEAAEIRFLEAGPSFIDALLRGEGVPLPLHPTSPIRLRLLKAALDVANKK